MTEQIKQPTYTFEVDVTGEHIAKGERGTCIGCPIALALKELFFNARVFVRDDVIDIKWDWKPGSDCRIYSQEWLIDWIKQFDNDFENPPPPIKIVIEDLKMCENQILI